MFNQGGTAGAAAAAVPPPPPPVATPQGTAVVGMDPATGRPTIKGFVPDVAAKPAQPAESAKPAQPGQQITDKLTKAVGGLYPFNLMSEPGKPGPAPDAKP